MRRNRWAGLAVRTVCACAALLLLSAVTFAAEPTRVLIVHAFGHAYSPWSDMAGSFRSELTKKSSGPIVFYEVSLDTARVQEPADEKPFVDYTRAVLSGRKPDLIVPIGAPAAYFIQRHRSDLFPASPMLILGANQRRIPASSLTENDAVVLLNDDIAAFVRNVVDVLPDTKKVAIVIGHSPVERYWASEIVREFQPALSGVSVETFTDLTFGDMLKRAATMPEQSAILWFLLSEDAAGVPYLQDQALGTMRKVANVPMFGVGDYQLGRGIIGGRLMQTQTLGRQAADVALRIFSGEKPNSIHSPYVTLGTPTYDWRELHHWNISESTLPPGSIVQFHEPGVWERYRWQIGTVFAVLLAQATIITGLFVERRRRRIAEGEVHQRLMEVMHLNRSAVAGALSSSIAHELNQPLGAIQSSAEAAMIYLKADPPNLARIEHILGNIIRDDERAAKIIIHLRSLLKRREESELQNLDLNEIVQDTVEIVGPEASRKGVEVSITKTNGDVTVRADRIQLQQVIMNLAMNGIDAMLDGDAAAKKMTIATALVDGSAVEVSVVDSGIGIPADRLNKIFETFYTTKRHGTGLGLSIARTIIEAYGGKIWAENRTGGGTAFRFTLPLLRSETA